MDAVDSGCKGRVVRGSCSAVGDAKQRAVVADTRRRGRSQIQILIRSTCELHLCESIFLTISVSDRACMQLYKARFEQIKSKMNSALWR